MTSFFFYQIQLTTHSFLIFNSFSTEKINRSPIIKGHLDEFKFRYINSKTLVLQFFSQQSHSIKKALFSSSLYLLLILYIYIYIYIGSLYYFVVSRIFILILFSVKYYCKYLDLVITNCESSDSVRLI